MTNTQALIRATYFIGAVAFAQTDTFTSFDYPAATMTHAQAINDAGDIVGTYWDAANLAHGFLRSGGKFTSIDFPGAKQTWSFGINSNGDISGYYGDGSNSPYNWWNFQGGPA